MNVVTYTQPWPYLYSNRRYDEVTYWIGFTIQFRLQTMATENLRI